LESVIEELKIKLSALINDVLGVEHSLTKYIIMMTLT
jgi:hypothetical protein